MLEPVLKGQRFLKLTHSIIHIDEIDFSSQSLALTCEYHIRYSGSEPATSTGSVGSPAALGVSFLLPDGDPTEISSVTLNGRPVLSVSPLEDLENIANFTDATYWAFPESANSDALAQIFSRVCENRRDLISYEEITKAHKSASLTQSFGLLVKIPPHTIDVKEQQSISLIVKCVVKGSPIFKIIREKMFLATIGVQDFWFPVPSRLMLLPSGTPVTAQPMEHQRHKVTVRLDPLLIPSGYECVASGDRLPSEKWLLFESSWVNPRSMGIFIGPFGPVVEEKSVYHALSLEENSDDVRANLENVSEIIQVLAPWFTSPVQLLPQLNLVFLPLPVAKSYCVYGNTALIDSTILSKDKLYERKLTARTLLAEAIAALWVERAMPAFSEPWLPVAIGSMLADRFVEFHFGTNEFHYRIHHRKLKYHSMVERGLDWRPLPVIGEVNDPVLQVKGPLVLECLRRSVTGDSDLRAAFHEMATIAGGKKGPWTSEMFLYLITCTVGQHTEAGKSIPSFKENWIKSVGVPVIHVGFSMLEKRRFSVNISQRPLQKYLCHDFTPLCSTNQPRQTHLCSCGQDFVARKSENLEGGVSVEFMRDQHLWPTTIKRRFWPGDVTVSVFRASAYYVPVTVRMEVELPNSATTIITVPSVTPRKHEMHLNRASREDELVHGYLSLTDDRWLLAKILICQSSLMWCNKLTFSRNVLMEQCAIDALQHIRGSTVVHEALIGAMASDQIFWRTRIEAGRGLVHMAIGCAEREALHHVVSWMSRVVRWTDLDASHALTWIGVGEYLAVLKRNTDRRDHSVIQEIFSRSLSEIETCIAKAPNRSQWKVDPFHLLANCIKFVVIAGDIGTNSRKAIDARIKSDLYGAPLASPGLVVIENVLAASLGNGSSACASWPFLEDIIFLEKMAGSEEHRRLSRMAVRACLSRIGKSETEEGWLVRLLWIEHLTKAIIAAKGIINLHTGACLVDAWEALTERARKESSSSKSPFVSLLQKPIMCDKLWTYLTHDVLRLPPCIRGFVQTAVHGLYLQVYGTAVPGPYKACLEQPREDGRRGPMSFWLPLKDHERIYRRFIYRGVTVKPEIPRSQPSAKRPKLLITSAGSIPLAPAS